MWVRSYIMTHDLRLDVHSTVSKAEQLRRWPAVALLVGYSKHSVLLCCSPDTVPGEKNESAY